MKLASHILWALVLLALAGPFACSQHQDSIKPAPSAPPPSATSSVTVAEHTESAQPSPVRQAIYGEDLNSLPASIRAATGYFDQNVLLSLEVFQEVERQERRKRVELTKAMKHGSKPSPE